MRPPKRPSQQSIQCRVTGFTLVELLTAIAIMSILGVILIMTLGKARQSATQMECVNNLRSLGAATMLYVQENNGNYPVSNAEAAWDERIMDYLGHPDTGIPCESLKCPNDERELVLGPSSFARSYTASAPYVDPQTEMADGRGMIHENETYARQVYELTNPADTVLYTEWFTANGGNTIYPQQQFKTDYSLLTGWYGGQSSKNWPTLRDGNAYHGQVMNFCFADGHVESLEPWAVNSPTNRWLAVR